MRKQILNARVIILSALLLALSVVPCLLGVFRHSSLLVLLLVVWPAASLLVPLSIALRDGVWYIAFTPVVIFLIMPLVALLPPSAMENLGAYLFFYALLAFIGALIGGGRNHSRSRRMPGKGLGRRSGRGMGF